MVVSGNEDRSESSGREEAVDVLVVIVLDDVDDVDGSVVD